MSEPFVLRHLIDDVLRETDLTSPEEIADEVIARIPRNRLRDTIAQSLPVLVAQTVSRNRGQNSRGVAISTNTSSVKVAAIRDGWQRRLRDRVHVGGGVHKMIGDCTYNDLVFCAAERKKIAEHNEARAQQFASWARMVSEAEVETFGELPMERQMQALGAKSA